MPDRLFKVEEGKCNRHANLVRGATDPSQCVRDGQGCVKPLLSNLKPSTNGVLEYRSNVFARQLKASLFLTRFSDTPKKKASIARVVLNGNDELVTNGATNLFRGDSGLKTVEGPRGEIVISRVFKNSFYVLKPNCVAVSATYLIGVHPKRGPAKGGYRVLVSGYNFGAKPTTLFGPEPCTNVQGIDDQSFTCLTPLSVVNTQAKVVVDRTMGENTPTEGSDYCYWKWK